MATLTTVNVKTHILQNLTWSVPFIICHPMKKGIQGSLCGKEYNDTVPHPV